MIREEAVLILKCVLKDLQRSLSDTDNIICSSKYGFITYGRVKECLDTLEQEPTLEKIKAEFISLYPKNYAGEPELGGLSCVFSLNRVLRVIDKYNTESEINE